MSVRAVCTHCARAKASIRALCVKIRSESAHAPPPTALHCCACTLRLRAESDRELMDREPSAADTELIQSDRE